MPFRSPAEYFCKYLLSRRDQDYSAIVRSLEDYGIDSVSVPYLKRLREQMDPQPEPWDLKSQEVRAYLRKHGIHDMWFPNTAVREAFTILSSTAVRSRLEQLLLSPLKVDDIVSRLNGFFSMKLTVPGVQTYSHYFWNKNLLSTQEWVEYLETRPMAAENISILRISPDMAQTLVPWATGVVGMPTNITTGMVSRRVRDLAFLKILETEHQPATLAHSKMLKNYMDVIRSAEEQMRQSDVALKDVLAAFEQFRLRTDPNKIPSIEEVAGPNFSQSGQGTDREPTPLELYDREAEEDEDDD